MRVATSEPSSALTMPPIAVKTMPSGEARKRPTNSSSYHVAIGSRPSRRHCSTSRSVHRGAIIAGPVTKSEPRIAWRVARICFARSGVSGAIAPGAAACSAACVSAFCAAVVPATHTAAPTASLPPGMGACWTYTSRRVGRRGKARSSWRKKTLDAAVSGTSSCTGTPTGSRKAAYEHSASVTSASGGTIHMPTQTSTGRSLDPAAASGTADATRAPAELRLPTCPIGGASSASPVHRGSAESSLRDGSLLAHQPSCADRSTARGASRTRHGIQAQRDCLRLRSSTATVATKKVSISARLVTMPTAA
mmetsp:Transcript_19449/g.63384  ORF Transcript_19449/g.63384 Transcript_19449/m.63384 type:complete len:307 (+) Transcript_19449:1265-2185(+)